MKLVFAHAKRLFSKRWQMIESCMSNATERRIGHLIIEVANTEEDRLSDLLDASLRVFNKYGAHTDWSEWRALRDALVAYGRSPLPMETPDGL